MHDGVDRTGDNTLTFNDRLVVGRTGVIEKAHEKGLMVHTWAFRNDSNGYGYSDPRAEMSYYFNLGIDSLFTDFADTGVVSRDAATGQSIDGDACRCQSNGNRHTDNNHQ